ncbi:ABC transporter permease subunit [Phytomonospora sp. NPDC050363]|uniref:ABC transporter permease subunit n=1 Tax=Phytomonospora sp. NPDC050363 TaxID=3155642 RepID=UPI0034094256
MIRLTWRQFQASAVGLFGALAVLVALLGATGAGLADEYDTGLTACTTAGGDCQVFIENFADDHSATFLGVMAAMLLLPALIGLFWGAPLIARELESGTLRLVWNQSITRGRWFAVKLTLTGLATVVAAGALAWVVNWWSTPVDKSMAKDFARMDPLMFGTRGIVVVGYAAFAFALGVVVGMLARKTLAAMAITLAVFVGLQIAMPILVRPHLAPAISTTVAVTEDNAADTQLSNGTTLLISARPADKGAWILADYTVDPSGKRVESITLPASATQPGGACAPGKGRGSCLELVADMGYRQVLEYQPSGRYWGFQWGETGIYLGLALGLAGFCSWWVRRRLS